MKLLRECGLVKAREEGKWTYYSLDAEAVQKAKLFLCSITSEKEDCICKSKNSINCEGCDQNV
jgi:ArsR family transcriptional regulator